MCPFSCPINVWRTKEEIKLICCDLSLLARKWVKILICIISSHTHGGLQGRDILPLEVSRGLCDLSKATKLVTGQLELRLSVSHLRNRSPTCGVVVLLKHVTHIVL